MSFIAAPAEAQSGPVGRQKVGEIELRSLSTSHPYVGGVEQLFEISHPGATYVKVHFSKFELAEGDRLIISNPDGTESYVHKGRGYKDRGANFWAQSILGDRAILRLQSANPAGGYGFDIDHYAYGIVPLFPPDPGNDTESVCGANNWRDIECYESSYPTEYERAKSAVVVLYNGTENCTGVKVGCPNQILTNEHCVTNQAEVDVTEVRFEYQNTDCEGSTSTFSEAYLGDQAIQDNFTLDYMLLTVEGASDNYEAAELDPRLPAVGERIYITHHGAGLPKLLSVEDDTSPNGLCRVDLSPTNGRGTNTDIGYFCDTTGGSSGSPVWSGDTHKVIALHHFGGCANGGVRMDLIYPEIEGLLTSCCENPPNTPTASAIENGDNQIDISWDDSALATVVEYEVLRSRTAGGPYESIAVIGDTSPGVANGASYNYVDNDVSGGITYYYTVTSTDGATCSSEQAAEVSATATGECTLPPIFAGVGAATAPLNAICTLDLTWSSAVAECGGPITYNVYRSPIAGFTPSGANLLVGGLPTPNYSDINQLSSSTIYHYVVRAVDSANGVEDSNTAQAVGVTEFGCTTASACGENPFVNVLPDGPMTVCQDGGPTLTAQLTGGVGPFDYEWLVDGQLVPGANSETFTPNDMGTHSYNARVRSESCPDRVFDGVATEMTRVNRPSFGGIVSATNTKQATCGVDVAWDAATTVCSGPIEYTVFRSTTTPVLPIAANLVAGGLSGLSYSDTHDLQNEQNYFYLVQARDMSTGQIDGNIFERAVAPDGPNNGEQPAFEDRFEIPANFADWTVTTGPGAHTCGDWAISSDAGKRPALGSGGYLIADNECSPLFPRTSTVIESPATNMLLGDVQAVYIDAKLRYEHSATNGDETGSISVWDGSQWVEVWTDSNTNYNQNTRIDVSAHAIGNSAFKVRISYQNASVDRYFAVDDFAIVTDVLAPCTTAAAGPVSVSAQSLLVGRTAGTSDKLQISWDTSSCTATDYNLLFGDLSEVSSYNLMGSDCSIGTAGSYDWDIVPNGNLFFLLVGTDGVATESSWGQRSGWGERNGMMPSNQCGVTLKDATDICP